MAGRKAFALQTELGRWPIVGTEQGLLSHEDTATCAGRVGPFFLPHLLGRSTDAVGTEDNF